VPRRRDLDGYSAYPAGSAKSNSSRARRADQQVVRPDHVLELGVSMLWHIICGLLCSDGCSAAATPVPPASLVSFSTMVAAGQTRIKVPSSLLFFLLLNPTKYRSFPLFSRSCGSTAQLLPPASFLPPYLASRFLPKSACFSFHFG